MASAVCSGASANTIARPLRIAIISSVEIYFRAVLVVNLLGEVEVNVAAARPVSRIMVNQEHIKGLPMEDPWARVISSEADRNEIVLCITSVDSISDDRVV